MATFLYSASVSLDGFLAGPGGDMSWLSEFMGPNPTVDELRPRIGALLIGNRTFGGDDPNRGTDAEGAYEGTWHGPQFVLTHRPPAEPVPDVTFVDDLDEAVRASADAAGDGYVSILGADVARQCLSAGVVDEVLMVVVPVLLGDGVRLFDLPGGAPMRLDPISVTEAPTGTNLWYRVRR
jgi:dihydrofolate reductase